jgi:hypothetical protein
MIALRRLAGRVLLVLGSILATLGLVECGLRISGAAPLSLSDSNARGFSPEHPLLRLLQPNLCHDFGRPGGPYLVEVCTNAMGLRDRNHAASESPRVLGLGDSFTFGWGVEQNDTFLSHLERALRIGTGSQSASVWKAGLSYTSQAHQDVLLRHIYDGVRPDLVVLAFSEDNDIDENIVWNPNNGVFPQTGEISPDAMRAYRSDFRGEVFRDFAFRHSALVRFFRQRTLRASVAAEVAAVDERLAAHGLAKAPLARMVEDEARRRFLQAFSLKYDDDFRVTTLLLDRIQRFIADRKGRLVLLRIPSRMSVEDPAWTGARERFCGKDAATSQKTCGALDRAHTARRLADYAKQRGISFVDPEDALRAAFERGETPYLPEDIHLSRLGHERVGEKLAELVVPAFGGKATTVGEWPRTAHKARKVGAYFYPWYRGEDWGSFTDYTPEGGAYLSTNRARIEKQILAAERADLDFFVIELLADHNPESRFNNEAVDAMVSALAERRRKGYGNLKFAVMSDIFVGEADISTSDRWTEVTRKHLDQIWARFVEPHRDLYVELNGKPLVGIFSPPTAIEDARYTVVRPYWVSHEQWNGWERRDLVPFWDTYPQAVIDPTFVSVTPGYNDWRLERQPQVGPYLPRLGGRTFVEQWRRVFEVDPEVALVYSFNEYFEQSQIEPTVEQGDRYLLLNRILARRFKDGRPLSDDEASRLVDAIEPPASPREEKVAWLAVDDRAITSTGLERNGRGRATLTQHAELDFDCDGDQAFVVGIGHAPTFDRCSGLSVTVKGGGPDRQATFPTDLTQLSILRDAPFPKSVGHLKVVLERVPGAPDCKAPGQKPIVVTGVARYPLATAERLNFRVDEPAVHLEGFWDVEQSPSGSFSWSKERATVTVSGLTPGVRHRVMLTFRDTAGFGNVDLGPDDAHLARVALTPGRTATISDPMTVSHDGTLAIRMKTATWSPHERFKSEDVRMLGLALRLITLDRLEGASATHPR